MLYCKLIPRCWNRPAPRSRRRAYERKGHAICDAIECRSFPGHVLWPVRTDVRFHRSQFLDAKLRTRGTYGAGLSPSGSWKPHTSQRPTGQIAPPHSIHLVQEYNADSNPLPSYRVARSCRCAVAVCGADMPLFGPVFARPAEVAARNVPALIIPSQQAL